MTQPPCPKALSQSETISVCRGHRSSLKKNLNRGAMGERTHNDPCDCLRGRRTRFKVLRGAGLLAKKKPT